MNYNLIDDTMDTTSAPITEPITAQNVKDWIRMEGFTAVGGTEVAFTEDDAFINSIIVSVRSWFEQTTWLTLTADRTRKAVITNLCGGQVIPFGPVKQITAATDMDGTDILTQVKTDGLQFLTLREPLLEKMTITYTCGYGSAGVEKMPEPIKHDMLRSCAWFYLNRGDVVAAQNYAKTLAGPYSKKPVLV